MALFSKSAVSPVKRLTTDLTEAYSYFRYHNDEIFVLHSLPNIILAIKSRRMRQAGHVARMGERRDAYRGLMGMPKKKKAILKI